MKENRKEQSKKDTAEKQELLIVEMLEYLIEHGDYHDVSAIALELEEKMKGIGLYYKWIHEMSGQNLHDKSAQFNLGDIKFNRRDIE